MAGLTFLFANAITNMNSNGISWNESQVGKYVKADGVNNLVASVKSAIAPVKKRSIVTEQYATGNYLDTTDTLFLLSAGEVQQDRADTADARLGLGPNKDQIYLAASAMGEVAFRQNICGYCFLRDTFSNTYIFMVYGNTGNVGVSGGQASVRPAFCL